MKLINYGIIILIIIMLYKVPGYTADIIITVPDAQLTRVKAALLYVYPNIECNVTVLPDGNCSQLKYTDNQWLKEIIRRWVRDQVSFSERTSVKVNAESTLPTDYNTIIQ